MAPPRVSKASVDYGPGMKTSHCGICKHFTPPDTCSRVLGKVRSDAWCKLFARRAPKPGK